MTAATQESAQQTTPGKKRRWLLPVVAVILAALAIGGNILVTHWPFASQKVIQPIQEDWSGKVAVQRFHQTYFPHPGCVLENVTLTRGSDASAAPLVSVQKVTIQANYHDMLLRPGYISRIILEGLKISVPAGQQSTSNQTPSSGDSSVRLGEVVAKNATLEIARRDDGPLKFDIHSLVLRSVKGGSPMSYDLSMHNPLPAGEIRSRGKLGPWDSQHIENVPLSGKYNFDQVDLGSFDGIAGILVAQGEFRGVLGRIETQGTTDTPEFQVTHTKHSIALKTKFNAVIEGTTGDTILQSVDTVIRRTPVHAEGTVASKPGQPGKTTTVNLSVRDGRIGDVVWLFVRDSQPPIEGAASLHARVIWPSGNQAFLKRVVLQGDFVIEHAQLTKPEAQAGVNNLSKKASGIKDKGDRNKTPANAPAVTEDFKGTVLLSQEIAKFRDTTFKVPGAEATMQGTYNLQNHKIDFHGDLKTEAPLSDDAGGAKAKLLKPLDPLFKRKHAGAVVPVEAAGTYDAPHFGVSVTPKK